MIGWTRRPSPAADHAADQDDESHREEPDRQEHGELGDTYTFVNLFQAENRQSVKVALLTNLWSTTTSWSW